MTNSKSLVPAPLAVFAGPSVVSRISVVRSSSIVRAMLHRGLYRAGRALSIAVTGILFGVFGIATHGQSLLPTWTQQSLTTSPAARENHAMAYDAAHGQVVLFGGYNGGYLSDTWLWNGTTWTQANPATVPPARANQTMVYDSVHGQVVMFGGSSNSTVRFGDTWLWDGTNWTQATPVNSPPARNEAAMAYDSVNSRVVLFGGLNLNGFSLNDTWLWDGTNWTQGSPQTSPSTRTFSSMAWDPATNNVVLFGGQQGSTFYSDTWDWNGTNWNQQAPANPPPARSTSTLVYDTALGRLVLFGGYNFSYLNDTWFYDGTNWTQSSTSSSPSGRSASAVTYGTGLGQEVLFGGVNTSQNVLSDTWVFGLPGNFGNVNVCSSGQTLPAPCSGTLHLNYSVPNGVTLGTPQVVTQGAGGLDFTLPPASTLCTAGVCTVTVNFAPLAPGVRQGAVELFDNSGSLLATTLIYGVGQGPAAAFSAGQQAVLNTGTYAFNQPKGLAVDAAGNVYIADTGAHNDGSRVILKVAPNGTQTQLGTGLMFPQGIAVDGAGDLFVADNDLNQVIKIPAGCTSSSCQVVLATPQCVIGQSGLCAQLGVAVDGPGNVFIASFNSEVLEVPANGGAQTVLYNPSGSNPVGIAVDSGGDLFITDVGLKRVVKVPAGCASPSCQTLVGSGWSQPSDVAVDAAGDVFVTDGVLQELVEVPAGCIAASCQVVLASGIVTEAITVDTAGDLFFDNLSTNSILEINRSQPQSSNFGTTSVGRTITQFFTFQNIGNQPLNAESPGLITVVGPNFVSVPGTGTPVDCSTFAALTPGQACNLSISFSPQTGGPLASTAIFSDNALNAISAKQSIALSGTAVGTGYTIGGSVSGLTGIGLVLENNLADTLPVSGNGAFTFPTTLASGSPYSVTILTQPTGQSCSVANGIGVVAAANVTTVQVNCVNLVYYGLTVTAPGTGAGTVTDSLGQISCAGANGVATGTCSGSYVAGAPVTLTATASGSSLFVGWGGACSSSGASPVCLVTMNSALNVSASFVAPPATQAGTLKPITAGVVYGQLGSFASKGTKENGAFSANTLFDPDGLAVDSNGNLYVSDQQNSRVLFYPAGSTTATRIYGQLGDYTSDVANKGGTSANSLNGPFGIALDGGGGLYVADYGNNRVLFYPAGSTTATRVYGQGGSFTSNSKNNGGISANSLYLPTAVALDSGGNLYVADQYNSRVLFYPAGSTTATRVYGQGGSFTSGSGNNGGTNANTLAYPTGLALDSSNDLYVSDGNNSRVLFYPNNSTTATQVYGQSGSFTSNSGNNGGVSASSLNYPAGLTLDSNGNLYAADANNGRVLFYPFGSTTATRVYGQGGSFTSNTLNNGGISANSLAQAWAPALDKSGNLYVADLGNNRVLKYGSFGNVNVCPAGQVAPAPCSKTVTYSYSPTTTTAIGATQIVTQGVTGLDFAPATGNSCTGIILAGSSCNVNVNFTPLSPGLRKGAVELYDNAANLVASTQVYGIGLASEIAFGPGIPTTLPTSGLSGNTQGVAVDAAGNVYVADYLNNLVVKIAPNGAQTTVLSSGLHMPTGVAVDGAGDLFIANNDGNGILQVTELTPLGVQTVLSILQPATTGKKQKNTIAGGIAVDGAGNLFVGDFLDGVVVEIPAGCTTTACQTFIYHPASGSNPSAIAVDASGNIYVADAGLGQVVQIAPNGTQSVLSNNLPSPAGVAVDAAGDVFVSDSINNTVVETTPSGVQTVLSSTPDGAEPNAIAVDASGNVFISNSNVSTMPTPNNPVATNQLVEVSVSQRAPAISFATTNVGSTSVDSPVSFTAQNVGNQPLTGSLALNLVGGSFAQNTAQDCSASFPLSPGAICSESFSFTPQSATFFSGTATFTDNSLNSSPLATQTVPIIGIGATNGVAATVAVPNVVGQTQAAAATPLSGVGLSMGTVSTTSSQSVPSGMIISENPVAGTQVAIGSVVNLLVSSGLPQAPPPNPLLLENNYFLTGDYVSGGVTLRGTGNLTTKIATGTISIPKLVPGATMGIPDGADVVDAFLYWETIENTAFASSTNGTFNGYSITGQQIGSDVPNYTDGAVTGTIRSYRASVNAYLPVSANGIRIASGNYTVSLPDSGGSTYPLTEGASLVLVYRVLSPNFPLKSVVIYDGAGTPVAGTVQIVQGFYDAVGGANGFGKSTTLFASNGTWSNTAASNGVTSVTLGQSNQYSASLTPGAAYAAVILSTPVNNSDNDGILDAWKTGPTGSDFHAGQPGYYDAKTSTWVGLPGAKHGQKDLFVQLDYMCGAILASGACDPTQENLFPSPDASGNDPLVMVQQAFANSGVQLHLQIGNAIPEATCVDDLTTTPATLCQFPNEQGVVGWKNSLEFSKLYPKNLAACITGGDCTTRFPYGQKDSYHYVLMGHSLAIPAWNSRYGTLTSINVVNGVTTIGTVDRGTGINACPSRITLSGVLGDPTLNGVYNTTSCADTKTITVATPGVPNYTYPNTTLPEPVIGLTSGTVSSISGYSDLGGADSAVTLGLWLTAPNQDMSKKANVLAGTIFHEIGHTLGLSHGGLYYDTPGSYVPTFDANCKPNYQSSMNYLFQLDGVGPNDVVAFSNQTLASLNESIAGSVTSLLDTSSTPVAATFPTSAWYVPYTPGSPVTPATRHCDGTPLIGDSAYRVDAPISPITPPWTNGQDLNFIGTLQTNERGFNDLANMDLRQVGATGGEFASLATILTFGSSIAPLNINSGGNVTLGSGGTITLGSGGNVTLGSGGNVTLGSGGTITLGNGGNVTLGSGGNVTLGSGGTITLGSGGNVTLGSGGNVTLGSGGTITLGSGGTVTIPKGSGGNVTLGSGGTITLGSGGVVTVPSTGGSYSIDGNGGTITLGSGGNVTLGSGGNVTLGSGGTITLGSGGNVTLGSGGNITLGSGGTITLGSGGTITLGSGGNVTLGSGGNITLGSGGTITLGSGGNVTLGSGGTVTLGSGGSTSLSSGGNVTLGSGGAATLGAGGTITLGSGGNVTLGSGGNVTLGSGGTITLGSGGNVTLGSGGNVTLGSGGTITLGSGGNITLGSGGTVTLGSGGTVTPDGGTPSVIQPGGAYMFGSSGGTITLGSGGNITLGSGGNVTLGSGGTITLGSGGNITLGSGGNVTLGSGGNITLGSGGTITLGSGGNVTLGSGGVVTLGNGGSVTLGSGESSLGLATVNNITPVSGGPQTNNELTYETANSVVRPPSQPTETPVSAGVRITWNAPAFGVVQTYTIYRSSNGATPVVIGSVSGVNGFPPATEFTDTNPDLVSATVVYTISTILVPDTSGPSRQSPPSPPAVIKNDQSVVLGPLPSSVTIANPPTVTATAMSGGTPNGLQVAFTASGSCAIGGQTIASGVSSATVTLNSTGSCTVTAAQSGSNAFNAATAVSGTFMVLPNGSSTLSQTITFAQLPSTQYGKTFSPSASSTSRLPVSFTASGPCTPTGGITGVGLCTITASAPGNSTYSGASLAQSFTIYPAVLKVTAINASSSYGQPLPVLTYGYSGFVNNETLAVVSGAPGLSTTATTASSAGSYPIVVSTGTLASANYSFLYVNGTLTIQPANQSALTLTTSSPLVFGQSEPLSVAGGSTGGLVTYNVTSGPCSVSGALLTANSGTGSCTVTATMAGNNNYSAVTSTPANTVNLSPAGQTITFTTNPPASAGYGTSFTVAASGGASGNAVLFTSSGSCSVVGLKYTMTSGSQSCSVIANQAGNSNYAAATQVTKTVAASLISPTVTFTGAPASAAYLTKFTVATTTNASSTAVITSSGACTNVGTAVSMTSGTGTCLLTATWAPDSNYTGTVASQTTIATVATQAITFTTNPPASAAYNSSFAVAATGGASGSAVTFTSAGACSVLGATYKMTSGTGTCSVIANQAGSSNYAAATQVTKIVNAALAAPTVTFTGAPASAAYLTRFTVAPTTNASSTAVISSSGACTNVGTAVTMSSGTGTCLLTATWASDSNYSGTMASQSTIATPLAQTITFTTNPPATAAYNSSFVVAATGGASGNAVTFTSAGVCSNAGATYTMTNSTGTCSAIASQAGNANYAAAVPVTKTVSATGPLLTVSPSSINFGTVYQGSISSQTITVTNTGTAAATITDPILSIVKGGNSNEFVALNLCPKSLAAGKSCTVLIGFIAGPYYTQQTATLQIMSNAPGSPQPVALSALVINPVASFSPTSLSFATIKHATSTSMSVTLTNSGGTPLSLSGVSVTGANATSFAETNNCGNSVAAGASCVIAVKFAPAAAGSFNANLTVVDNAQAGGGTQTVALSGKGN